MRMFYAMYAARRCVTVKMAKSIDPFFLLVVVEVVVGVCILLFVTHVHVRSR